MPDVAIDVEFTRLHENVKFVVVKGSKGVPQGPRREIIIYPFIVP